MDKASGEFSETGEHERCLASKQDLCWPFAWVSTSEEALSLCTGGCFLVEESSSKPLGSVLH